jgi:hypothetical protein
MRLARALVLAGVLAGVTGAEQLEPETVRAFDRYMRDREAVVQKHGEPGHPFLWVDEQPSRLAQVREGQVVIEETAARNPIAVPGGLIHDWIGAAFIPRTTMAATLKMIEDYNHHKDVYQPEVMDSRLVRRDGNDFHIRLRVLKKRIITVVLDTEYDVHYQEVSPRRWYSRALSTRIVEVEHPGKPGEATLPPGNDHGFLWRLDSYWRFEERDGGVYIECEAISLTRDMPAGLGWIIEPIVKELPREALAQTLRQTRAALAG